MGCGGSKTEPQSPRRRPQRGMSYSNRGNYAKGEKGANANGNAGNAWGNTGNTRGNTGGNTKDKRNRGRGRNRNNNVGDEYGEENVRQNQKPIYEKGYKKRIRENLRNAAAGEEIEPLEKCMEIFVNNHMEDGGDLTEAHRRLDFLHTRKEIRDACMRKHPVVLDKAIQRVEASPYRRQLKPYLDRAYYLKQHQQELDTFRHDILNMEQSTISEIRSYHHPPPGVHETMCATYLCLGYPENHLVEWPNISNLMGRYGKDSLINEVSRADTQDLDSDTSMKANKYLNKYTLDQVRTESTAAATFHVWDWVEVTAMMGRYGKDSLIREISLADTRKLDRHTAMLARNYLSQYSFEEVRSVSNGAAVFYVWASRMVGKYEGDKKGASQQQTPTKTLINSRRGNTPTGTEQQNQGQFKARPAPAANTTKDAGQSQKQTKAQQYQAKQPKKQDNKQSPKTSANDRRQSTKTSANDARQTAKTSAKDAKQTAKTSAKDNKQVKNATQAKSQVNNVSSKAGQKKDPFAMNSTRKNW